MTILTIATTILSIMAAGNALKCYQCGTSPPFIPPEGTTASCDVLSESFIKDCSAQSPIYDTCAKEYFYIGNSSYTIRYCSILRLHDAYEGQPAKNGKCYTRTATEGYKIQTCLCNSKLCNSGFAAKASLFFCWLAIFINKLF